MKMEVITYELLSKSPAPWLRLHVADSPARSFVVKDKDGKQAAIRYCENQSSFYVRDQNEFARPMSVAFIEGSLTVPTENKLFHEFMSIHYGNEKNGGNIFRVVDFEKMANEEMSKYEKEDKAIALVKDMNLEMKQDLLRACGYPEAKVIKMMSGEISLDARRIASSNPQKVLDFAGDTMEDKSDIVSLAIKRGLIDIVKKGAGWVEVKRNYEPEGKMFNVQNPSDINDSIREYFASSEETKEELTKLEILVNLNN